MPNKLKQYATFFFLSLLLLLLLAVWLMPAGTQNAPSATLTTLKGERISLADLRGKPVLVTFWATTCPGCLREMPHLVELYQQWHPKGLEVIGVAMAYDPPNQVVELVQHKQIPYTIALDIDGQIAQAFGDVKLTPTSFMINPQGRIVLKKIGEMDMSYLQQTIQQML